MMWASASWTTRPSMYGIARAYASVSGLSQAVRGVVPSRLHAPRRTDCSSPVAWAIARGGCGVVARRAHPPGALGDIDRGVSRRVDLRRRRGALLRHELRVSRGGAIG